MPRESRPKSESAASPANGRESKKRKPAPKPHETTWKQGEHGDVVRLFMRGKRGPAYLQYQWRGRKVVRSLGFRLLDEFGSQVTEQVNKATGIQQRCWTALREGKDPSADPRVWSTDDRALGPDASTGTPPASPAPRWVPGTAGYVPLTIEEGLDAFFAPDGPTKDLSRAELLRYEQANKIAREKLKGIRLKDLTGADLELVARAERERIVERAKHDSAFAGRTSGGDATGTRQAEIVVKRFHRILRWLRNDKHWTHVPHLAIPRAIAKELSNSQLRDRPRFDEDTIRRIEAKLPFADPRLQLLIAIQVAQRAGQLLRVMRSKVKIEKDVTTGDVRRISIEVPSGRGKPAGRYFLPMPSQDALLHALERGFLRDLEAEYQRSGRDFPLFPGVPRGGRLIPGRGRQHRLSPDDVLPVQSYIHFDRTTARKLFRELEADAGVPHERRSGFHGFRRRSVDALLEGGATLDEVMAAGSWSDPQMPYKIYTDFRKERSGLTASDKMHDIVPKIRREHESNANGDGRSGEDR